jgi:hypothetical protein
MPLAHTALDRLPGIRRRCHQGHGLSPSSRARVQRSYLDRLTSVCLPWSEIHLVDERTQRAAMPEAMPAWNTDHHVVYIDTAGARLPGMCLTSPSEYQFS